MSEIDDPVPVPAELPLRDLQNLLIAGTHCLLLLAEDIGSSNEHVEVPHWLLVSLTEHQRRGLQAALNVLEGSVDSVRCITVDCCFDTSEAWQDAHERLLGGALHVYRHGMDFECYGKWTDAEFTAPVYPAHLRPAGFTLEQAQAAWTEYCDEDPPGA